MKKITYKKANTIINVDDRIHLTMGYEIRVVDEDTYKEWLNNPLYALGEEIDDEDDILI